MTRARLASVVAGLCFAGATVLAAAPAGAAAYPNGGITPSTVTLAGETLTAPAAHTDPGQSLPFESVARLPEVRDLTSARLMLAGPERPDGSPDPDPNNQVMASAGVGAASASDNIVKAALFMVVFLQCGPLARTGFEHRVFAFVMAAARKHFKNLFCPQ